MNSFRGQPITNVSLDFFLDRTFSNLKNYPRAFLFWWPIIHDRAEHHKSNVAKQHFSSAADLLLNPLFRWAFLNRREQLAAFEEQLKCLDRAMGTAAVQSFSMQLLRDLEKCSIENEAHNRFLSAWAEIRAAEHFAREFYNVQLIPRRTNQKTPDLRVMKDSSELFVEVKYIRTPDKLGEYLLRWWVAQKDIAGGIPFGRLPHLRIPLAVDRNPG
jgi:hypothetical protein